MSEPKQGDQQVVVMGADGQPMGSVTMGADGSVEPSRQQSPADLIEQPAKVMRIGSMVKQLLEEVRQAPLDEASRTRLREVHQNSIAELSDGLAPELREELERLTLPFDDDSVPVGRRAADRPGAAGRLAGGAVPRHPDRAVRAADGGARAAGADARPAGAAGRCSRPARPGTVTRHRQYL
jgi:hypothetical protein